MLRLMNRRRQASVVAGALVGTVGALGGLAGAAPAHADSMDAGGDEYAWCVLNFSCFAVQDATNWAHGTAEWMYPGTTFNGIGDAFRHCIWSGAIANRVGYDAAYTQVIVHEDLATDPMDQVTMDIANDLTGLDIGVRSLSEGGSDTWGWIISECATRAENGELAGLNGVIGAY